ncbi:MAG TPA: UDP-N-acetylmuramate--L-alanine ligase [Chitinophagaceae bacterium]|nr:UDP-N-acetylmuramate--L-alanine ligase [Chitinophagaceae bacterium]
MKKNNDISNLSSSPLGGGQGAIYFIGIGGIGMSAIARYFHSKGINVSGYDKTETALTKKLTQEGIPVHYTDDVNLIPKKVDLVVYTPAIPKEQTELQYYNKNGFKVVKRSDVLQTISEDSFNICVAGTHGKTTVSCMIAHILRHSGFGCNAFLGGISANYNTNFWSSENNVCVIEADEYDRSFLKLSPDISVITAMDADHLDIYGDEPTMQQAFIDFGNKTKNGGLVLSKFGLKRIQEIKTERKLVYSLGNESADAYASEIQILEGGYVFNVHLPNAMLSNIQIKIGGMHNVENMVAAIVVVNELEIAAEKIKRAVADFQGVKRRFEYIIPPKPKQKGEYNYPVFIDDYAHHPEELKALLKSARALFNQRKITVIFQPHLFTRTRDFADEFASSLSIADEAILLPIYPARELPIEGVTSEMIFNKISSEKKLLGKEELLQWAKKMDINKEFGEVIITAGAGDIDALVQPLKEIILQK